MNSRGGGRPFIYLNGYIPLLCLATDAANGDLARLLLAYGADPEGEPSASGVPLVNAARCGDLSLVQELLRRGASVRSEYGRRALHAAGEGHDDVIRALVARGADVNAHGDYDAPPLIYATGAGKIETLKLLLSLGARADLPDGTGKTAFYYAIETDR